MANGDARFARFLQQENTRLKEENRLLTGDVWTLSRRLSALQNLQETIQQFTPDQDILLLLDKTLDCAMKLLDAADGSLLLVDEETDELVFVLVYGEVRETLPGYRINRHRGIAGWVAENGQIAIVNDVRADPRFVPDVDERFSFVTHSLVAVPLLARGHVLGVIELLNKHSGDKFTDDDANLLSILASLSATALDYAMSVPTEA